MSILTREDAVEIECALTEKLDNLKKGKFGTLRDPEIRSWIVHVEYILETIGDDGENLLTE